MNNDVLLGAPRWVEAEKITAIQNTRGSQYLQVRANTGQKNYDRGANANAKTNTIRARDQKRVYNWRRDKEHR